MLLGAILCFAGVSFSSPTPSDDADQPVLATAGPGTTPARVHRRIPGVRVEDLPRVLVRAEDLPRAEVTDVGRRAYR